MATRLSKSRVGVNVTEHNVQLSPDESIPIDEFQMFSFLVNDDVEYETLQFTIGYHVSNRMGDCNIFMIDSTINRDPPSEADQVNGTLTISTCPLFEFISWYVLTTCPIRNILEQVVSNSK